jgi:hypothetical protein
MIPLQGTVPNKRLTLEIFCREQSCVRKVFGASIRIFGSNEMINRKWSLDIGSKNLSCKINGLNIGNNWSINVAI